MTSKLSVKIHNAQYFLFIVKATSSVRFRQLTDNGSVQSRFHRGHSPVNLLTVRVNSHLLLAVIELACHLVGHGIPNPLQTNSERLVYPALCAGR